MFWLFSNAKRWTGDETVFVLTDGELPLVFTDDAGEQFCVGVYASNDVRENRAMAAWSLALYGGFVDEVARRWNVSASSIYPGRADAWVPPVYKHPGRLVWHKMRPENWDAPGDGLARSIVITAEAPTPKVGVYVARATFPDGSEYHYNGVVEEPGGDLEPPDPADWWKGGT